jgi:hypothetical protein
VRQGVERAVLAKHGQLELLELVRGLDAELLVEPVAELAVGGQRLGLAPRAVEGDHELAAQPLAQGLAHHEPVELGHELGVVAQDEVGVDALLEAGEATLLQVPGDVLAPQVVDELVDRHRPIGVEQQAREKRPLARSAEPDRRGVVEGLERTEDAELHRRAPAR